MPPLQDYDGPVSLTDVLRDGWGDEDFFGSATDTTCTGGADPAASHCRDVVGEPSDGIAESPVQTNLPAAGDGQ